MYGHSPIDKCVENKTIWMPQWPPFRDEFLNEKQQSTNEKNLQGGSPQRVQRNTTNGIEIRQVERSKSTIEKQWCLPKKNNSLLIVLSKY